MPLSRRRFIRETSVVAATIPFFSCLSSKKTPAQPAGLMFGYSAITWGGNDLQAIKDISALGFKGIQLRSNAVRDYGSKPQELRALLQEHKLRLPMFSSGNANINTGNDEEVIQMHMNHARFVKAIGGENIQVTNASRPRSGAPSADDLRKYGKLIDEIGRRTLDIGVTTNYHNHMHQLGETPEEVDIILENCSDKNVKFLLDIAHYHQGGGDPAKAIRRYEKRLSTLHLKDVRPNPAASGSAYTFVELGQGNVDLPAVFKALSDIRFRGWGIVELDAVPDKEKTPVACANITKAYLQAQGIRI